MTLEHKTLKVHLSRGTEKQQLAAATAMVNGIQSQLAAANALSHSGKAVDTGGQNVAANQSPSTNGSKGEAKVPAGTMFAAFKSVIQDELGKGFGGS